MFPPARHEYIPAGTGGRLCGVAPTRLIAPRLKLDDCSIQGLLGANVKEAWALRLGGALWLLVQTGRPIRLGDRSCGETLESADYKTS
jgi:hypothetical protein